MTVIKNGHQLTAILDITRFVLTLHMVRLTVTLCRDEDWCKELFEILKVDDATHCRIHGHLYFRWHTFHHQFVKR
jgi:hypothetical protein